MIALLGVGELLRRDGLGGAEAERGLAPGGDRVDGDDLRPRPDAAAPWIDGDADAAAADDGDRGTGLHLARC